MDPHHHRQARARARIGRPDVDRQPVVAARPRPALSMPNAPACGGGGPNETASRTPAQPRTGRGAANRSAPTGGSANGMPRKTATPGSRLPRSTPAAVRTSGRDPDGVAGGGGCHGSPLLWVGRAASPAARCLPGATGTIETYSHGTIRPIDSRSGSATTLSWIAIGASGAQSRVAEQGHGRPPHGHPRGWSRGEPGGSRWSAKASLAAEIA